MANETMDRETAEHFYAWLDRVVDVRDQHNVEQAIHGLLREHPDLLMTHGWSEMRRLAGG